MEIEGIFCLKQNVFFLECLLICNYELIMNYMLLNENKASLKALLTLPIGIIILWMLIINQIRYHIIIKICIIFLISMLGQSSALIVRYIELKKLGEL